MTKDDIYINYKSQYYLSHHGILGQKWGVRRYQNKDGSLTKAGEKRAVRQDRRKAYKNRVLLSDQELDDRINRMKKEKQLKELTYSEMNAGKKVAHDMIGKVGSTVITAVATAAVSAYVANKISSGTVDKGEVARKAFNLATKVKK